MKLENEGEKEQPIYIASPYDGNDTSKTVTNRIHIGPTLRSVNISEGQSVLHKQIFCIL